MGSPIGQRFISGEGTSRTKAAKCEKCQTDYVYRGDSHRPNKNSSLGPGVVPCPQCGWLQTGMVRSSRGRRSRKIGFFFALTAVLALIAGYHLVGLGLLAFGFVTALVVKTAYNPNSNANTESATRHAMDSSGIALPELDQGRGITEEALQRELYSCLRKAMLSMAGIDGDIDPNEIMAIRGLYYEYTDERVDVATLENEAKRAMGQQERMLNGLHCLAPYLTEDDKAKFLRAAGAIAAADGRIDPTEIELIQSISESLDVAAEEVDSLLTGLAVPV